MIKLLNNTKIIFKQIIKKRNKKKEIQQLNLIIKIPKSNKKKLMEFKISINLHLVSLNFKTNNRNKKIMNLIKKFYIKT